MFNALLLTSGLFWTITYLLIIRRGFLERTYGMPVAALAANLSWEFIFAVLHPHGMPQVAVNWIWLLFDLVIAAQLVMYGARDWGWPRPAFLGLTGVTLCTAFPAVLFVCYEFADLDKMSGAYAAFGQNLMMSVLFLNFYRERGRRGQSTAIACCKFVGTLAASLAFLLYTSLGQSPLMLFLFSSIAVFDLLYVGLLAGYVRLPGVPEDEGTKLARALEYAYPTAETPCPQCGGVSMMMVGNRQGLQQLDLTHS